MKLFYSISASFCMAVCGVAFAGSDAPHASHESVTVIALKTDEFEIPETDVSHLGVGDAETIYTEDGRTIDILRAEDGIEVYVDGELLEVGSVAPHDATVVDYEIVCNGDEECDELVYEYVDEAPHVNMVRIKEGSTIMIHDDEGLEEFAPLVDDINAEVHKKVIVVRKQSKDD